MFERFLPGTLALAVLVGAGALGLPSRAEAGYSYWSDCHGALDRQLEPWGLTSLCDRYTFVVGPSEPASARRLHAIPHDAAPIDLGADGLLVLVDTESAEPAIHLAAYAGLLPQDAGVMTLLQWVVPNRDVFPKPQLERRLEGVEAEVIADAGLFVAARRLGLAWGEDDGVALFDRVIAGNVPELGLLLISARLSDSGRTFFRELRASGREMPLDALLAWRITTRFDEAVAASSTGRLPCVRTLELNRAGVANEVLERLGVDLGGTFQLARCSE